MDILIDFDGTCVKHEFPNIGGDIGAVPVLKALTEIGHRLILFTMRSDHEDDYIQHSTLLDIQKNIEASKGRSRKYLTQAVNWFKENDIPLFGIQSHPDQLSWTSSPKVYGHLMIDDSALGCPLRYQESDRPYVDWQKVWYMLPIHEAVPKTSEYFTMSYLTLYKKFTNDQRT